ncbi:RYamide receptor [Nematostella vectensis]|nr:RYamide receptor [Nematostella vectensis]
MLDPTVNEAQDTLDGLNYFKLTLFVIILVAGLLFNTLLFLAATRKRVRHRRTARSFIRLIQNLAIADIALLLLAVPFDSGWWAPEDFPYGGAMCKIIWPLKTAAFQAIVLTYVLLSFHRTYGVKQALFGQMNDIFIIFVLFLVWIGSVLSVIPYVIFLNYDVAKLSCAEMWPLLDDRRAYSAILFLLQYLLPLMVLIAMYFVARYELRNAVTKDRQLQKRAARHRRVNTMLIVYIVVFAVITLPEHVSRFVMDWGQGNLKPYFFAVMKLLYFLILSITVTNPVLFFYYNPEFKKDLFYFLFLGCFRGSKDATDAKSESFSIELPPPGTYTTVESRATTMERRPEAAPGYPGSRHSSRHEDERDSYRGSRDPVIPRAGSRDRVPSYHGSREKMGSRQGSRQEMPRYGSRDLPPEDDYPVKRGIPDDEYRGSRERLPRDEPYRSRSRERLPSDEYRDRSLPRDEPYRSRSRERLPDDEPPYRGSREPVYPREEPYRSRSRERLPEYEPPDRGSRERIPRYDDVPYRAPRREDFPPREPVDLERRSNISSVRDYDPEIDDDQGSEML